MSEDAENKNPKLPEISRREFAFSVAMAAAGAAFPATAAAQQEKPPITPAPVRPPEPEAPKLSDEAKREVELKNQAIMDRHGSRLSESQKADVRKLMAQTQEGLETLRAFPIENGDEPATILHFNDVAPVVTGARR